jgi:MerR family mercuric resistance operon transcriptional regulator
MAIGEFSRRTGRNIETIRYYERIGLLPLPDRRGRYRRYDAADVDRLILIRRARELGFTLDAVRALLRLSEGNGETCAKVRELAARHLTEVKAKIADLPAMEQTLAVAVRRCDAEEVLGCPLIKCAVGRCMIVGLRNEGPRRPFPANAAVLESGRHASEALSANMRGRPSFPSSTERRGRGRTDTRYH